MRTITGLALLLLLCGCGSSRKTATPAPSQNPSGATRLNHIAIQVSQLERSTVFYRDLIGLDTIPEPFHDGLHTWFQVGPYSHLHLIQGPGPLVVPPKGTHL